MLRVSLVQIQKQQIGREETIRRVRRRKKESEESNLEDKKGKGGEKRQL